jgi:ketosteroid isomerase-like protein
MTDANRFTYTDPAQSHATAAVVRRFITAFQDRDAAAIRDLVAPDCIMEAMQPAPDGFDAGEGNSVRGVTLIRVRDGKIAEALAYAKTPVVADLGQASRERAI